MKKIGIIIIAFCFVVTSAMPSFAGRYRHHPRPHPPRVHHPPVHANKIVHKYKVSYDYDWGVAAVALGVGVVTGAVVGSLCGPPPRRVYAAPAPVVVTSAPTVIVQQPATVIVPSYATAGTVAVIPSVLNVRSGPGAHHPVIGQVYQGTVLYIKGNANGWFYVALPSGGFGWVMAQHTTAASVG